MKKIGIIVFLAVLFYGCSHAVLIPGYYKNPHNLTKKQQTSVWASWGININSDSTYKYSYRNSGNYQEHSYGRWDITPSGRLMLRDTLSKVSQIPIKVNESKGDEITTVFEFSPNLEPAFWNLVMDNVIYPIIENILYVPEKIESDYFYLLGFNKEYEGFNSPNDIVKTELYYIADKNNNIFNIEFPEYAVDHEILFYNPMNTRWFIIKKDKLIEEDNKIEFIRSR